MKRYIDEFTFRLNQGIYKVDTLDCITILFSETIGKTITLKSLINENNSL